MVLLRLQAGLVVVVLGFLGGRLVAVAGAVRAIIARATFRALLFLFCFSLFLLDLVIRFGGRFGGRLAVVIIVREVVGDGERV